MHPQQLLIRCNYVCILSLLPFSVLADAAAEMQKKLQNPLANIKTIMTDNVIGFTA